MAKKLFGIAIDERIYDAMKRTSKSLDRSCNYLIERALAERFGVIVQDGDLKENTELIVKVEPSQSGGRE